MRNLNMSLNIEAKFDITMLVSKLKMHRDNHIADYAKAMQVYEKDRVELFGELANAANKQDVDNVDNFYRKLKSLAKPVDAKKMYDEYITILESSADKQITMSLQDANAIINDSWEWAESAKVTNAVYSSRAF
jgi:transketolase